MRVSISNELAREIRNEFSMPTLQCIIHTHPAERTFFSRANLIESKGFPFFLPSSAVLFRLKKERKKKLVLSAVVVCNVFCYSGLIVASVQSAPPVYRRSTGYKYNNVMAVLLSRYVYICREDTHTRRGEEVKNLHRAAAENMSEIPAHVALLDFDLVTPLIKCWIDPAAAAGVVVVVFDCCCCIISPSPCST